MFVLCPHCHFLVGIDPRTGAPPPNCPKCGGMMVEARPQPGAEPSTRNAPALEPFAPVALPSVSPVLPDTRPEPEPIVAETAPAPVPEPGPAPEPATAPVAALEPTRKPRWWSWRTSVPTVTTTPASPATAPDVPPPAMPVASPHADTKVAIPSVRRRATRQPLPVAVPAIIEAVAIDAPPPGVQAGEVVQAHLIEAAAAAPDATTLEDKVEAVMQGGADRLAAIDSDHSPPAHPLRRRTDTAAGISAGATGSPAPTAHPLRRHTDLATPSFTRPRVRAASRTSWRSLGALVILSLLLALQLLLAQRDTLAASPRWRPTIATLCATLRCTLPPWREPTAFTMLSRDVRPHPGVPGTLLVNASFRNDARWVQPWPSLLLTLSDLDGRMVGARTFAASDYLGAAPAQSGLAPGQTAAVSLVVVEPAPDIVAFTFDFR